MEISILAELLLPVCVSHRLSLTTCSCPTSYSFCPICEVFHFPLYIYPSFLSLSPDFSSPLLGTMGEYTGCCFFFPLRFYHLLPKCLELWKNRVVPDSWNSSDSFELSIAWFWPEDFTPSECLFDGNFKEEMAAPFQEDIKAMKRWVKFWCPQGKSENWLFVVLAAWKRFSACK